MSPMELGFIGCDRTAVVLARGLCEHVLCAEDDGAPAAALVSELGGELLPSYEAVAEHADIIVLCHGQSVIAENAAAVRPHARIVVSTVPETPLGVVQDAYPGRSVYRIAVNTAVQIRRGVTVLADGPAQDDDHLVLALLGRSGKTFTVDDALIDTAAGVLDGVEADCIGVIEGQPGDRRTALDELERFLAG